MMQSTPNINKRLALVLWGATLFAFVLVGAALTLYQSLTLEKRALQIMEPYARLVAVGADAAVAFEDTLRAQEILDTLRANPQILGAVIYLADGRTLASFSRQPGLHPGPAPRRAEGVYVGADRVELLQELTRGARLGLSMGMDQLEEQTHQAAWLFGVGVLILLVVTFAQMAVLRRMIARPIATLTEATERVRSAADYTHRVPASGDDEVGRLGQNFNAMMEAIHEREEDLRRVTLLQRAILDNAAYGIISADADGMVTSFNHAAERLLGYAAEEIVGRQSPALWHDRDELARYARQLSKELGISVTPGFAVFTARPQRNLPEEREWTFIHKDGRRIPVNLSVTALRDASGEISGFVGLAYDLSERKLAEAEIRKLNQELEQRVIERTAQLEEANRELEAFSYSVSHDLRTPLRAIDGFSRILLERQADRMDEEGRRLLGMLGDNAKRMAQLIEDMLRFSRTGRMELTFSRVDMEQLAHAVAEELRAGDSDSKMQIEVGSLPPAHGDIAMLRQVWVNLLSNAIKFSRNSAISKIEVGAAVKGDETVYHVKDNGVGFSQEYADKLFGVFQRLHGVDEFEGTGIGLAIVKRIVNRHGGRVWAEGKVGEGAAFYFSLPVNGEGHE
jgi:PAS domain S-box-containing protein